MLLLGRNPYPFYYRTAFAYSIFLCPHVHQFALRLLTLPGDIRVYHVPLEYLHGLGLAYLPVVPQLRQMSGKHLVLTTYLLVQACQHL